MRISVYILCCGIDDRGRVLEGRYYYAFSFDRRFLHSLGRIN